MRIAIFILPFLFVLSAFIFFYNLLKEDFYKKREVKVLFSIQKGESSESIIQRMKEKGIIKYKLSAKIFGRKLMGKVKAGEFLLENVSPYEALKIFAEGIFFKRKILIAPCESVYEVAEILEREGITTKEEFLNVAFDREKLNKIGIQKDTAEGFLYPDTYFFIRGTPPEDIIKTMFQNFLKKTGNFIERKDFYDLLILASIVEKESQVDYEMPIIAGIFLRRLKMGMKLEADPTALYGIGKFDKPAKPEDLRTKTPYNTYIIYGLPPTPICSPSIEAINSVLYPKKTDYLFFVAKGDGTHLFAKTYEEHIENIRKVKSNEINQENEIQ